MANNRNNEDSGSSWCAWLIGAAAVVAGAVGIYRLTRDPIRVELVHEQTREGWTARVFEKGPWSKRAKTWSGSTRIEIEFIGPEKVVERSETDLLDRDLALLYVRSELLRRSTPAPTQETRIK